jgi:undecaprenyl-diphosphatase
MSPIYTYQLEFIRWLHTFSNPFIDGFFKSLNFFDNPAFFFVLIPAIWVGYHWKSGLRIAYIIMLSGITNGILKNLFLEPRPFNVDPTLGIMQVGGYGFPSGAAQTVIILSGILLTNYRNKWTWILCINYVFWVSLSRVYLGVHVPTDILGGWAVGTLILAVYTYARPPLEKWLEKTNFVKLFLISQLAPLMIVGIYPGFSLLGLSMGWGLCLSKYWKILLDFPKGRKEFITRGANLILHYLKVLPRQRL